MGKTTRVAEDRAFDQTKTVLPAEVARGVYMQNAPSLRALKLMHLMIAKAGGRMADDVRHELRLSDIRQIEGMAHHDKTTLKPLFTELRAAVLTYDEPEAMRYTIGGLLDHATVDYRHEVTGDVLVTWYFSRLFRDMAAESNHWAILDRQTVFHLGSKYAVLLFQHIASLTGLNHVQSKTFTVPELRALFGVSAGKLNRFADLNRWALKPAIEEINQLSRLTLTAIPHKVGRTVATVEIVWTEKAIEGKAEAKRELDRHKVGRQARRNGSAETPVLGFPAGSISFGPWGDIARQELPKPCKDVEAVAQNFRRWCSSKSISLSQNGIEGIFRKFCQQEAPAR